MRLPILAWKHRNTLLINGPLATDERIFLITGILSDDNRTEAVKRLCGDGAQSVIVDVKDEVLLCPFTSEEWAR